jgi:uncharacterized protein (DUF2336 family)
MEAREVLFEQLEAAFSHQTVGYRAEALRKVTDLFVAGAHSFGDKEVEVFDDVLGRIAASMETAIRASLAVKLAQVPNAPRNLIRALASDPAIEVAGPVLTHSERLDEPCLVATARMGSQQHLLAISRRVVLSEILTDVLLERGDHEVARSTICNSGARFSDNGCGMMVERSKDDDELAAGVWSRDDIPRPHLIRLLTIASENVRRKLEAVDRTKAEYIRDMVAAAASGIQADMRAESREHSEASKTVTELHRRGELDESRLRAFALDGRFEETTAALALLCDLPIGTCERAMTQDHDELLLLMTRSIGLSWEATKSILRVRAPNGLSQFDIERALMNFGRLKPDTARKALHFLRLRERAALLNPGPTAYQ